MKLFYCLFTLTLFYSSVSSAQYAGGPGKGVTMRPANMNLGTSIFKGGGNDGNAFVQASTNLGGNIFKGGTGDGLTAGAVNLNLGTNIFKGGGDDGAAHVAIQTNLGTNIFKGGSGDGISGIAVSANLGTNIYKGGGGDGWAMVAVSQILLPVTLSKFAGAWNQKDAILSWQTSTEINSKHFELERSYDGNNFSLISTVAAAGNSSITRNYSFNDAGVQSLMPGPAVYYRLKTVDIDGKSSYSGIVVLRASKTAGYVFSIYPNPAKEYVMLTVNSELLKKNCIIRLADQNGKVLMSKNLQNESTKLEVAGYAAGIYYIQVLEKGTVITTQKLLINK